MRANESSASLRTPKKVREITELVALSEETSHFASDSVSHSSRSLTGSTITIKTDMSKSKKAK